MNHENLEWLCLLELVVIVALLAWVMILAENLEQKTGYADRLEREKAELTEIINERI